MRFCRAFLKRPVALREDILFTDEKWFDCNDAGVPHQWCPPSKRQTDMVGKERLQAPPKCFIWGVIGIGFRFLRVVTYEGRGMNTDEYIEQCLRPLLKKKTLMAKRILMQDGARVHWTAAARALLTSAKVRVLEGWPAHSADLNPIEHLWSILQRQVSERAPGGEEELVRYVQEEFDAVPEVIDRLVRSFATRCKECVAKQGAAVWK